MGCLYRPWTHHPEVHSHAHQSRNLPWFQAAPADFMVLQWDLRDSMGFSGDIVNVNGLVSGKIYWGNPTFDGKNHGFRLRCSLQPSDDGDISWLLPPENREMTGEII